MRKMILLLPVIILSAQLFGQKQKLKKENLPTAIKIPMDAAHWEYDSTAVEFITHNNVPAAVNKKGRGLQLFLKNQFFSEGTIEFDIDLNGGIGFPGINFRQSADRKQADNFYIRSFGPVTPEVRTTVQYAAVMDGMSIWDLSDEYQGGAQINQQGWNHVKLVVSGKQMRAYVNDMKQPVLVVPELEGSQMNGGISLMGNVIYANLALKPGVTEGLNPDAGYNSTVNDTRYIRNWMVSASKSFPFGKELVIALPSMYGKLNASDLPDSSTQWSSIKAEPRTIINLSRIYGHIPDDARRIAWLKTTIESDKVQDRVLNLGYSDEVWVFINGQILYTGKNYFGTPEQKEPSARCTIENSHFTLPLKEGKNEIIIGLANYFYGWGIVARLDDTRGIQLMK
ncbi:MAG: hypothetical protein QM802_23345 [Agriterribacter sp.]